MVQRSVDTVPDFSLSGFSPSEIAELAATEAEESARLAEEVCDEIDRDLDLGL